MIDVIRSDTRGHADHGWLKARHTFSFADYYDAERVHFGPLRVINEDRIAPQSGFDTHPHRDMEIITYIVQGVIEHKDSMGNGTQISAGEVQRMTAGTGVLHSEFNRSADQELHLLQIWILPEKNALEPGYEQTLFAREDKLNQLRLVASRDGREGSLTIHQDVDLAMLDDEKTMTIAARRDAEFLVFNLA
jgi:redox-sensitive bicupin YhaK (pirin superfamily)